MNYEELVETWRTFDVPANIYRIDGAERSRDDLVALAQRAGIDVATQGSWEELGPLLELEQAPRLFTVYQPSRAVQFVDTSRWQIDDGTSMTISDDDAIAAANRQLERLELTDEDQFVPTKVTRLNVGSSAKGAEPVASRVIDVGVVYSRVLDDIPVEGQGGKIVVYLDSKQEMTGFERTNRKLAVHEPVAGWRSLDDVLAEVEDYWHMRRDEGLDVDDARLCYVELGRLEEQEYVQPAYALSLTLHDHANGEDRTVDHYVVAATNGIGTFMPTDFGPPSQVRPYS
jgi:hypothetical protein